MDWDAIPGAWKIPAFWSSLDSHWLWEVVWPLVVWCQMMAFCSLLLVATVGARLKLRKKYVELLDRMFHFAAAKLPGDDDDDEEESHEDNGVVICPEAPRAEPASPPGSFSLQDTIPYLMAGMKVVVHDSIRKSFLSAELQTWNMLSRTKRRRYLRTSPSLTVFYALGFLVRWVVLMPVRLLLLVLSLTTLVFLCASVGLLPTSDFKRRLNARVVMWAFDFVAGAISVVARFHNTENRPSYGIAVANHTSPIDSMVLATDQCYDMVGQKSRGLLGVFMTALARSSHHIWFDRAEVKERSQVTKMIQEHAQDRTKPPILMFPEGVCVNNTAVLQFKKGIFEVDSVIYPIAVRFDLRYGNPHWGKETFALHLFFMMTSWAIVCDVWYLPPTRRGHNESATSFANRVRALIAHRGGFVDLPWDGFKFAQFNKDSWENRQTQWRNRQQLEFARHLSLSEEEVAAHEKQS